MYNHIDKLHLQNFQSIKGPVTLEFKPLTFLYGQNSVGKSAIFDAFEVLLDSCHNRINENLYHYVHNHIYSETTIVGASFHTKYLISEWNNQLKWSLDDFFNGTDYLDEYDFGNLEIDIYFHFSNKSFSELHVNCEGKSLYVYKGWDEYYQGEFTVFTDNAYFKKLNEYVSKHTDNDIISHLDAAITSLKKNKNSFSFKELYYHEDEDVLWGDMIFDSHNHPLYSDLYISNEKSIIDILISLIFEPPIHACQSHLAGSTYKNRSANRVGPIRSILTKEELSFYYGSNKIFNNELLLNKLGKYFNIEKKPDMLGDSAWQKLSIKQPVKISKNEDEEEVDLIDCVNDWLSSTNKLGMPYKVGREIFDITCKKNETASSLSDASENKTDGESIISNIFIMPTHQGDTVRLYPNDVGSGVSQVLPILVSGYQKVPAYLEQPELHLHPKMQSDLADFFISRWNQDYQRFAVETHSEHIALRVLRRIRESSNSQIMPFDLKLNQDDVIFYYFDNDGQKTDVTKIRVSDDGEFLDRWPKGFFSEREKELFDEDF